MSGLDMLHGYSAYEVAVINGFSGTEAEWLESIKGKDGNGISDITLVGYSIKRDMDDRITERKSTYRITFDNGLTYDYMVYGGADGQRGYTPVKGKDYFVEADKQELVEALLDIIQVSGAKAKIGEVTLPASAWVSEGSLHSQVVEIEGVTEYSQVDLTPSVEQLAVFYEKDLTFVTENEDGVVTVYAIGQKPTNDYTIQVTITEVEV
jgi:hypothetical protein